MPNNGVLLSLPTESVAVRAALGSLIAILLVTLLLRGLRAPRVRSVAVLVPTVALVVAVILSWGELGLPTLMTSSDASNGVVRFGNAFVNVALVGWPLLAAWALVVSARVSRRLYVQRRARRALRGATDAGSQRARRIAVRVANRLQVAVPPIVVADRCPGGATVVGIRRPTVVVDAALIRDLDDGELEGLVAHELAHVKRHDNLVALLVGLARDVAFFLPGGRWVVKRLRTERELAADQLAVHATGRPCALASGLLKAIEANRAVPSCGVAFASRAFATARVQRLIDDAPRSSRLRTAAESAVVAAALTAALALALQLPRAVAETGRLGLAVVWTGVAHETVAAEQAEATAFSVYRDTPAATIPARAAQRSPLAPDDIRDVSSTVLRGGLVPPSTLQRHSVTLQAQPRLDVDEDLSRQWLATPLVAADDYGVGLYWLRPLSTIR